MLILLTMLIINFKKIKHWDLNRPTVENTDSVGFFPSNKQKIKVTKIYILKKGRMSNRVENYMQVCIHFQ